MAPKNGQVRIAVSTFFTAVLLLGVSTVVTSIQGHASEDDLAKVELEAKERDAALLKRLEDHLRDARQEAIDQARFRGLVAGKLGIDLDQLED